MCFSLPSGLLVRDRKTVVMRGSDVAMLMCVTIVVFCRRVCVCVCVCVC